MFFGLKRSEKTLKYRKLHRKKIQLGFEPFIVVIVLPTTHHQDVRNESELWFALQKRSREKYDGADKKKNLSSSHFPPLGGAIIHTLAFGN